MHSPPASPSGRAFPLCFALLLTVGFVGAGAEELPFQFESNVMVAMRDGTKLAANIFRPRDGGRHPVILMRSPYGKPDEKFGDARRYVGAGYAMVVQDCRGRGKAEGPWDPFRYDVEDGFDTLEWVGTQPWCNGSVGTAGGSYVGWTQWSAAAGGSKYLKCMVPVVPFAEVYDDIAYPGGAFQLGLLMGWGSGVGGIMLSPEKLQAAYRYLPLANFGDQFEKKVPYLNEWARHPSHDAYWNQRGIGPRHADITVPILNIGGWYDIFAKNTLDLISRVRASSKDRMARRNQCVVMGPWAHGVGVRKVGQLDFGAEATLNIGDLQFQWHEYWLQGRETGVENWPAVRLFVMGENQWRDENEWPLRRTRYTSYYLNSQGHANTAAGDGQLEPAAPGEEGKRDEFTYDPADPVPSHGGNNLVGASAGPYDQSEIEQRQDVLVYTTPALSQPLEVTGPVKLILWAATSAPDTDFTAKLVDVDDAGKAFNLCEGIVRARYRAGRDKPQAVVPGELNAYEIDLWVTSNLFQRGHRIRVEVSSSNFPRFDRNPNSGLPFGTDTAVQKARQTIQHDAAHPSRLVLPVIPRPGA